METPKPITGPYRATRLWNEAIRIFNNGVPRKRHWRHLKQYENCFTAAEATTWLHCQLKANPHFGPSVTKEQTQQLLCKFLKAGVFEDVRGIRSKIEHIKENSGLFRLTNKSPFRNPRTPGRTPLSSLANRSNNCGEYGSPKLALANKLVSSNPVNNFPSFTESSVPQGKTLVQCQLTAKHLNHQEVEEVWKNATLRRIAKIFELPNLHNLIEHSQIQGKWVLWNVTQIGGRGVVQPMGEIDAPPTWVLYGMKSLVNWPSNENHKLPEYQGSEKDVFKVICDYFTNVSSPLSTFSLYNILVEAFIRSEATDLSFQKSKESFESNEDGTNPKLDRDSLQSKELVMGTSANHKTQIGSGRLLNNGPKNHLCLPIVKSPVVCSRTRSLCAKNDLQEVRSSPHVSNVRHLQYNESTSQISTYTKQINPQRVQCDARSYCRLEELPFSACYETAFTTAEPMTRMVSHSDVNIPLQNNTSNHFMDAKQFGSPTDPHRIHREKIRQISCSYQSLDRLRSKSGGYVNVAAFGSLDCLDRSNTDKRSENLGDIWNSTTSFMHSRSTSSLDYFGSSGTGLSPSSFSGSSMSIMHHNYENLAVKDDPYESRGKILVYHNSPSKRLIGRRKGLEFYYGAKACKPGIVTIEGKAMAIELLQLLTLLLPPDRRRKLHLILRFMAKVSANEKLVLDSDIPIKTLMINTFYRCIVCSSKEADYDELLAVRLVTFLMENVEAIMTVPPQLCSQVRDLLAELQREKIRFQLDDVVPLAYCLQVSPQSFEQQRKNESDIAIRQLLEHIVSDQNMSVKEKRKRLKQFQNAYPEIYFSRFPCTDSEALKNNEKTHSLAARSSSNQSTMFARIRSLRLI